MWRRLAWARWATTAAPTWTHGLLAGSPAIDAGSPSAAGSALDACAATDQRGIARPQDGDADSTARCDIGAFERQPGEVVASARAAARPLAAIDAFFQFTAARLNAPASQALPAISSRSIP